MGNFFSTLFTVPAPIAGAVGPILQSTLQVWDATWWFFLPLIAAIIFWDAWLLYLHVKFLKSIKWVVLEIKVPKNVLKTPKAMEQIFAAAHTPYSYGLRWQDKYFKGADEMFMSFELVGSAGETHFYLRVPDRFRNMMESAIFAQYPEAEVVEVEDYFHQLPHVLPNKDLDVGGFELKFKNPNWYPLRTYPSFEETIEEHRLDPIAPLIEAMAKLRGDQQFWIQFTVVPTGEDWVKKGEEEANKILGIEKEEKHKKGLFPNVNLGFTFSEVLRAPFEPPKGGAKHEEEKKSRQPRLVVSASDKERVEGIAQKVSKLAFETTIRFVMIERRGETPGGVERNIYLALSYIRQFNSQTLNALSPEKSTRTFAIYGLFSGWKKQYRKRILFERALHLSHMHHGPILNIEELATLYHFPLTTVSTSELEKVESKKGAPPASLPLVEEKDIIE